MREALIGLDIGASLTKVVLVDEEFRIICHGIFPSGDPRETARKALNYILSSVPGVGCELRVKEILSTGGGSRLLGGEMLGLPISRINEIDAIGLGGLTLSGRDDCLVVSAGTGTALVLVRDGGRIVRHVGGTGVGGGTIVGLAYRMLGVSDFRTLEEMALKGVLSRVDLTIGDIVGGPIGILPAEVTASNFGKISGGASAEDIAAGIFNLVSQTITAVAAMAAKAYNLEDSIVITGMLGRSSLVSRIIRETAKLFSVKVLIPENCELATALGAIMARLRGSSAGIKAKFNL